MKYIIMFFIGAALSLIAIIIGATIDERRERFAKLEEEVRKEKQSVALLWNRALTLQEEMEEEEKRREVSGDGHEEDAAGSDGQ